MSNRNHKATFERKLPPDVWTGQLERWELECREFVSLEPLTGRELFNAQQVQSLATQKVKLTYSATTAAVTTAHRMKIRKPVTVNENEPEHDDNYRIFHIENIVNVREMNRELELMVQERV